jgi:mono/diheme cytochrome c family protein
VRIQSGSVTEVPEHLLARSRERRAALGLGGDDEGGAPAAAAPAEGGAAPAEASSAPVPAAAAAAPVIIEEPPPPPPPAYVAEIERTRVPMWVMPVLLALPFWGLLYFGAFGDRHTEAVAAPDGAALYRTNCSSCHGAAGEGGVGPALENGDAAITFPDEADHISWVQTGSGPFAGKVYGDPDREGGPRTSKGLMPGFAGTLSDAEIQAVVTYEREQL